VKRVASLFILFVMLFNGAGFYMYYSMQLIEIRHEMRVALKNTPERELEVLKFSIDEFKELGQDPDEIQQGGKIYDVARIKTTSDSVFVLAKHDEQEESLSEILDYFVNPPLKSNAALQGPIMEFLTLTFVLPCSSFHFTCRISSAEANTPYLKTIVEYNPSPNAPPPWAAV
jgi:hypothetical protein